MNRDYNTNEQEVDNASSGERYFALKDIAQVCGSTYAKVKRDVENGNLPAYRIGRKYFAHESDVYFYAISHKSMGEIDGYTIKEIMSMIPLSYTFIMDLIKKGELEAVKSGRQYLIPKDSFQAFLDEHRVPFR